MIAQNRQLNLWLLLCLVNLLWHSLAGQWVLAEAYQPRNSQAAGQHPMSPEAALKAWTMPEGFHVSLFAAEPAVHQPVAMTTDFRGRIWVAESYSYKEWKKTREDRIVILEDTDHDGRHDKRKVFYTGGNHVSGMTVGWGGVWLCDAPNLLFIPDENGDDVPDGPPEVVLDGWSTEASHNFVNGLKFGVDGWLYGRHGILRQSKVGKPGTPDSERIQFDCGIWRLHPVTRHFEVVCRGTTNPWGHDWDEMGELFFTNNVNGHLWHAVPGALFPRMGNRPDPNVKYDYQRMPMTADHLHHAGTDKDWTKSRDGKGVHGDLGGGHSHCGGMIYLADNWPAEYRGRIFMCNTHGRRLNQNLLERSGSGFVGKRAPDLFFANNQWFRGVNVLYGPDGGVYVSDWSDFGECHDNDGVHRTSGRVFKFTYGKPRPIEAAVQVEGRLDLTRLSSAQLVALHTHPNEWYVRKARLLLQWRKYQGNESDQAALSRLFSETNSQVHRIRALMSLLALNALDDSAFWELQTHQDEQVRKWVVRHLASPIEGGVISERHAMWLCGMAYREESPLVLLYLASAMQHMDVNSKWLMANTLGQKKLKQDRNLALMIWYGIKDEIEKSPGESIAWMVSLNSPRLKGYAARLLAEVSPSIEQVERILWSSGDDLKEVAEGIALGLKGRNLNRMKRWGVYEPLIQKINPKLADQLGLSLDRERTAAKLMARLTPQALTRLIEAKVPGLSDLLLEQLDDPVMRSAAIQGAIRLRSNKAFKKILSIYSDLNKKDRQLAVEALVSNKQGAIWLLDEIENGNMPASEVNAYQARQITGLRDKTLTQRLRKVWGTLKSTNQGRRKKIKQIQDQLTADVLAKADLKSGRTIFNARCQSCHVLFGEGGDIGPELTGADRSSVYYLLENIIDPNALLPRDFQVHMITRQDGSLATGMLTDENDSGVTLRSPAGVVTVPISEIKSRKVLANSMMPEGLLNGLSQNQIRDLVGYLMTR